jgi:hypothetical protein
MKKLLILCLFLTAGFFDGCVDNLYNFNLSHAANTMTDPDLFGYGTSTVMTFDSTGVQCIETIGYSNLFVAVDLTSGTATYDIETSTTKTSPNETGHTSDLTSDATADDTYEGEVGTPYLCVRLDVCSSCAVTATIFATGSRGN